MEIVALTEAVLVVFAGMGRAHGPDNSGYVQIASAAAEAGVFWRLQRTSYEVHAALGYLAAVLVVVENVELMNGFGEPESGATFCDGARTFGTEISDILQDAFPDPDCWSGPGALEYHGHNEKQRDRMAVITAADHAVAAALKTQAAQVTQVREGLASARLVAVAGFLVAGRMVASISPTLVGAASNGAPATYLAAQKYIRWVAWVLALTALGLILTLIIEGFQTEHALTNAVDSYKSIARKLASRD